MSTYSTSDNALNASLKISANIKKWINIDSLRGGNSRECQIKGAIISYIHDHYHYYHHHHLHHRHWHHWQLCCENLGSVWGVAIPASECAPTVLHRIIGSCVLRTVQSMSIVQFCAGLFGFGPQFNQVVEDCTRWVRRIFTGLWGLCLDHHTSHFQCAQDYWELCCCAKRDNLEVCCIALGCLDLSCKHWKFCLL